MQKIRGFIYKIVKSKIFWFLVFSIVVYRVDRFIAKKYEYSLIPFFWIYLALFAILIYSANKSKTTKFKVLYSYTCVIPLCLAIGEVWFFMKPYEKCKVEHLGTNYSSDFLEVIDPIGARPKPNVKSISKNVFDGEIAYDVIYSTDKNGWRLTPNTNIESKNCLVFFGDSFTFGEGLNDVETLPYFINKELNNEYRIYNFAMSGYGPHQALHILKTGTARNAISGLCENMIVFYTSLLHHIQRVNGLWGDGFIDPHFELDANDNLIWINDRVKDRRLLDYIPKQLKYIMLKSYLMQYMNKPTTVYNGEEKYNHVYFAVMEDMQREVNKQFGTDLSFVLWDVVFTIDAGNEFIVNSQRDFVYKWLQKGSMNNYYLISDILTDYDRNPLKYQLHRCDRHPTAKTNQILAKYFANEIRNGNIKLQKVRLETENTK